MADLFTAERRSSYVEEARNALEDVPKFKIDDDPDFECSRRIIYSAASLGIGANSCAAVENASQLILRHAYLVQHETAFTYARYIPVLYPVRHVGGDFLRRGDTRDSEGGGPGRFKKFSARLRQLAPEAQVFDAAMVLGAAAKLDVSNRQLFDAFVEPVREFHENAIPGSVCAVCESVSRAAPLESDVSDLVTTVEPYLCEKIDELGAVHALMVFAAFGRLGKVTSRRLAFLLLERFLLTVETLDANQCAQMVRFMCEAKYHHPMALRRLCNRLVLGASKMAPKEIGEVMEAIVQVPIAFPDMDVDHEVAEVVLERLLEHSPTEVLLIDGVRIMNALGKGVIEFEEEATMAIGNTIMYSIASHVANVSSDRMLNLTLEGLWTSGLYRHEGCPQALETVAREVGRRGGLPTADPEALRRVSEAVQGMVEAKGCSSAHAANIKSALRPIIGD